jgi:hypothetical protein
MTMATPTSRLNLRSKISLRSIDKIEFVLYKCICFYAFLPHIVSSLLRLLLSPASPLAAPAG